MKAMAESDERKEKEQELLEFLNLLELNGERVADVPEWSDRLQVIFGQLPEGIVEGFVQRIRNADGQPVTDYQAFAARFGLTPAETKLLGGLAMGLSSRDYAQKYSLSVNTARVHMQRILEKTEAKSQTDLLRMLFTS